MLINKQNLIKMVEKFNQRKKPFSFDIECTGLNPRKHRFIMLQFMQAGFEPVTFDMRREDAEEIGAIIRPLFTGPLLLLGQNLKFDLGFLWQHMGIRANRLFDTMIAEQLLYSSSLNVGYSLDKIASRYKVPLDQPMNKQDREWFFNLDEREEWEQPFPAKQLTYAENDVRVIHPIFQAQTRRLIEAKLCETSKLEMRVVPVLVKIESDGVLINEEGWRVEIVRHNEKAAELEGELIVELGPIIQKFFNESFDIALQEFEAHKKAKADYIANLKAGFDAVDKDIWQTWGAYKNASVSSWLDSNPAPKKPKPTIINLRSSDQMLLALKGLGLDVQSTDSKVLKKIDHPTVRKVLRWRKELKFVTSYGETLLQEKDVDGRWHFNYNQLVSTGRMSASRIQQIPKRGEGQKLRNNVVAAPGCVLLTCDYAAIEMRILAELSGDQELLQIFDRGEDIHSEIAR